MARHSDPIVAEVKKIRRKISRRLMQAHRKGRLHEEMVAIEREGDRAYREARNGTPNGRKKSKSK